jgi:RNA polymerase sigma factor (sigma-70 family)
LEPTQAISPGLIERYEGLVVKTSSMYAGIIGRHDFDDIAQVLRVKVWRALEAWDPEEPRTKKKIAAGRKTEEQLRDAFVFGCVRNQVKDLLKRNKQDDLFIEDLSAPVGGQHPSPTSDRFELRYLIDDPDSVFRDAEDSAPLIPNTLNDNERLVLACAYAGLNGPETASRIGMSKGRVASVMRSLREKLGDWRPAGNNAVAAAEPEPSGSAVRV